MENANEIIKGMGFSHMAIGAVDFDKSLRFYQALGLKLYTQWGEGADRIALLDIGDGGKIELFAKPDMPDTGVEGPAQGNPFVHFAFAVQNVDDAYATALKAGATSVGAPTVMELRDARPYRITLRVAFVKGPSGEEIEFFKQMVNRFF